MLHAVDQHDVGVVIDLVDDPMVTASSRPQPRELADEWLADSARVLGEGAEYH